MNLSSDGEEWEQWYPLEPFGRLRAGGRLGSIHLKLKIGAVVDTRDASSRFNLGVTQGQDDRGAEEEGYEDEPPNCLRITLHQVGIGGGGCLGTASFLAFRSFCLS